MWRSPLSTSNSNTHGGKDFWKQTLLFCALGTFRKQGASVMNGIDFTLGERGRATHADQDRGYLIIFMFWTMLISGYDYKKVLVLDWFNTESRSVV